MDNVAIYGGAFNPVTMGHYDVAKAVYEQAKMPVWMMPCFGHMYGKELAPAKDRFRMVELVAQDCDFITAFPYEIYAQHDGSMYQTLCVLRSLHPTRNFHLVMGMDNANTIEKWQNYHKLIAEFPCLIVQRPNYIPRNNAWWENPMHQTITLNNQLCSTSVRNAIATNDFEWAKSALDHKVWEYMQQNDLYLP